MTSLQAASSSSSSPSSPSTNLHPYDVFLSFRGEDTRTNFTAYLFKALCQNGINTFKDDEQLKSGEEISPTLLNAIKESKISIIIFSKSYASSKWCLNELTKILECKQMKGQRVLPVFYRVDPSDVRNQTKSFGEAFNELEEKFKDDKIKVQTWKTALTKVADLSGEVLGNRNEPELIDDIIKWVNSILVKNPCFQVAIYPVGIESRVEAVKSHLDIEKNDITCMVGIFGIGGIGKTTIAKAIYNSISSQFEGGSCFLENIRDKADQKDGLVRLQDELLSNILGESISMVENIDQRITLIKQRLCNLRIFLVLDDVDQPNQLEKLAGKGDWFGLGSRIIITTRDKHLLTVHGVDSTYQMNKLDDNEDLELFSFHASIKDKSNDDYVEVTKNALRYAGGLPLALIVVGSALKGRNIPYWKSKLDEYKKIPPNDIQKKLQISYDGLCRNAQDIFLHIACFFKGENVKYVKKILDSCGFYPDSGIKELEDKCLITQSCGSLMMHGLVQEMGREIVRQVSPYNPGRRTRLWFDEEVRDVLEDNTGTNSVEGILIDLPGEDLTHLSSNAFMEMKRLRLFISHNARLSEELNFSSNQLRLLYWPEYPGESLPSNFCGRKLAVLRMPKSLLKGLEGVEVFQNLTIMNFTNCEFLKKIPNVSKIPNLTTLILNGCAHLVEVHHSVGFLNNLVDLSLENCYRLRSFPRKLKLRNLESLVLCGCSELKNFPEIECQMKYLKYVDYQNTGIEKLPSSIGHFIGVKELYLAGCKNLKNLPDSIYQLQQLERLNLKNCTGIKRLPSSIRYLVKVKTLDLSGCTNLMNLPNSIYQLQDLEELDLQGCSKVVKFPDNRQTMPSITSTGESEISYGTELVHHPNDGCSSTTFPKLLRLDLSNCSLLESNFFSTFDCGSMLNRLDLSESDIVILPLCIRRFCGLKYLYLNECKQLQKILGLPPNVVEVRARGCVSLAILLEEPRKSVVTESEDCPMSLEYLDLSSSAIVSLPTWFNKFVGLERLTLEDCKQLREISELPQNIRAVYARGCMSLERFQLNIYPRLGWIDLSNCQKLCESMGNDLQTRLLSEGHPEDHKFVYMCPGNKIPNWFIHCKEVLNSNSFEIDIDELADLDGEIIRIAFCVVIGTKARQDEDTSTKMTESEQHEDEDSFSKITEGGQDEVTFSEITESGQDEDEDTFYETTEGGQDENEDEDTFSEITESGQDEDEYTFYETTEGGQDEDEDTFCEITEGGQDEDTFDETTESGQDEDEDTFAVVFEVINDDVEIYSFVEDDIPGQFHSDHVWLHYNVPESFKLKGDNLQVKFKLRSMSLSFKSCGFHLV